MPENDTRLSTPALLLGWLSASPDVNVDISPVLSEMSQGRGADVGSITTMGSLFGMAAYLIEHPGLAGTDPDVQAAGIASALLWYEASLRRGGGRNEFLDELLAIRDARGHEGLRAWWTEHVRFNE